MEDKQQAHIVLIGFMGTGKSTISQLLAKRLDCKAVDLDFEIECLSGQTIPELFTAKGEVAFRALETEVLLNSLHSRDRLIIATGGGAVLAPQNCKVMQELGYVVALKAEAEQIISRVSQDSSRPLLQGNVQERVYKLLEDRKHAYDFAHLTIDTTNLTTNEVVDQIWNHFHA
ncbi:shikimate kinase [Paenibacillus baekrokdamisoli]|uniref:Shikimate kinase n=1 Tax=Paenibacillus baekrokdamisoli TaxID=1712516 RepID=A0A3G9J964_9BACL|nr:shikimate kinase [Paenibacillus baekrokdamisoli]MBB3067209.1 shikimate kinase [Paenibacillus baekrokdamisoli]BBH19599.1 shikimate kinase [Paenibacillus baekrokdamisoli]